MQKRVIIILFFSILSSYSSLASVRASARSQAPGAHWIGAYALGDAMNLFSLDISQGANQATFYQFGEPFPQETRDLGLEDNQIQFTVTLPGGVSHFVGSIGDELISGQVETKQARGRFVLLSANEDYTGDHNDYIGSYRFTSGDRSGEELLVSRGDQPNQFFYMHGETQIRLFSIRAGRFFSARAEVLDFERGGSGEVTGLSIQDAFRLEEGELETLIVVHPYIEEEVSFQNGPAQLRGTQLLPGGAGPFPAVSLVHGAGASERHFYRIFADHFARNGIATLIYDKRGHGKSAYDGDSTGLEDLAQDASTSVDFLASHPAIDPQNIGVWGLSQGGRIAPMVAANNPQVAFVAAVSSPGVSLKVLDLLDREENYLRAGYSEPLTDVALKFTCLQHDLERLFGEDNLADASIDPQSYWKRVTQPALILFGSEDTQIYPQESAAAITSALRQGGNQGPLILWFPGADHNLMNERAFGISNLAPGFLDATSAWIQGRPSTQNIFQDEASEVTVLEPDALVVDSSRLSPCTWAGGAILQSIGLLFFCAVFLWVLLRGQKGDPQPEHNLKSHRLDAIPRGLSLLGLVIWLGFVAFAGATFIPQSAKTSVVHNALYLVLLALSFAFTLLWVYYVYMLFRSWSGGALPKPFKRYHLSTAIACLAYIVFLYYYFA